MVSPATRADQNISFVGEQYDLSEHPSNVLERELERLRKLMSMDAQNARRFKAIADRVFTQIAELEHVQNSYTRPVYTA